MRQVIICVSAILSFLFSLPVAAQVSTNPSIQDFYGLELRHDHVTSPPPESLASSLVSNDEQVRFKALVALGLPDQEARKAPPSEVSLRFASLGTTEEKQAIITVWMPSGDMLFGAVAAHDGRSWERIANFSCWCKYEAGDLLGGFVQVKPGPDGHSELVIRASGGGTGLYARDEVHFRYFKGELRLVFSFQDRFDECIKGPCSSIYRWFYPERLDGAAGAVLVEAHVRLHSGTPEAEGAIPDLQLRNFEIPSCKSYKWDAKTFRYEAASQVRNPCNPAPPAN